MNAGLPECRDWHVAPGQFCEAGGVGEGVQRTGHVAESEESDARCGTSNDANNCGYRDYWGTNVALDF